MLASRVTDALCNATETDGIVFQRRRDMIVLKFCDVKCSQCQESM